MLCARCSRASGGYATSAAPFRGQPFAVGPQQYGSRLGALRYTMLNIRMNDANTRDHNVTSWVRTRRRGFICAIQTLLSKWRGLPKILLPDHPSRDVARDVVRCKPEWMPNFHKTWARNCEVLRSMARTWRTTARLFAPNERAADAGRAQADTGNGIGCRGRGLRLVYIQFASTQRAHKSMAGLR
jgi:hypothetical protein